MAWTTPAALVTLTAISKTTFGDPVLANFAALGMIQVGKDTTERSTTSTTETDLSTIALSPNCGAGVPLLVCGVVRKSAGAAASAMIGLKCNTTSVITANAAAAQFTTTDRAEEGFFQFWIPPRVTGYLRSVHMESYTGTTTEDITTEFHKKAGVDMPTATLTQIVITGDSGNALVTLAVDEIYVYAMLAP